MRPAAEEAAVPRPVPERLLLWLAGEGEATVSRAALAQRLGCNDSTVRHALRDLEEAGVVGVERRFDEKGGSLPSTYCVAGAGAAPGVLAFLKERGMADLDEISRGCGLGVGAARGAIWALRAVGAAEPVRRCPGWGKRRGDAYRAVS